MNMEKIINKIEFPFPVFITKEGKWFVAECSLLGIAAQGRTEPEVKENIKDLIKEYIEDKDISKPNLRRLISSSLNYIPVKISRQFIYGKTPAATSK